MVALEEEVLDRQLVIQDWYVQVFPDVAKYIAQAGGDLQEAKDLFQDAIVIFYEQCLEGKSVFENHSYLFGITRNLWRQQVRTSKNLVPLNPIIHDATEDTIEAPATLRLIRFLETAGQKCMDILQSFYYEKLSANELAQKFGFTSERSATVQKYKCLEKVRNKVASKNLEYADFFE